MELFNKSIETFTKLWKHNRHDLMKFLFFILDKTHVNDQELFLFYFKEVKKLNPDSFYYNISHIVGKPNSKTFENSQIPNDNYIKFNEILNKFVQKEYRKPFEKNWIETAKKELWSKMKLPQFADWDFLIKLYKENQEDTRLKYIIIQLLKEQALLDRKNKTYSRAYNILKSNFPNENNISEWIVENTYIEIDELQNDLKRYIHIIS